MNLFESQKNKAVANNRCFYSENAEILVEQYDSLSFEKVHQSWLEFLPLQGSVLDMGAGSGRDARYMAEKSLAVSAIEPANNLLEFAKKNSINHNIQWISDSLPDLAQLPPTEHQYDLILISAVWMHLTSSERRQSLVTLNELLKEKGHLILTLRHGDFTDGRVSYPLCIEEVASFICQLDLSIVKTTGITDDELGRDGVQWQTIVLTK